MQLRSFLIEIGFEDKKIQFLPISAFKGINIVKKIDENLAPWYNGSCLMDMISKLIFYNF